MVKRVQQAGRSIGTELDQARGLGKGFDFLRVVLAFSVVALHTAPLAHGDWPERETRFLWLFDYSIMIVFFALSGFLIAGSAQRLNLKDFLINRSLRIVPALAVEIILSALLIGPIFTVFPLKNYFSDSQTYHYFTNIIGLINYSLPGVFLTNPLKEVNSSLWTVPYEMGCYAIMAVWMYFGLLKRPWTLLILAAACLSVGLAMFFYGYREPPHGWLQIAADGLFFNRGARLFVAFALGIAAYLYRYKIPYSWPLFWGCVAYYCLLSALGHRHYSEPPITLIAAVPLVYVMAFLGVSGLPSLPLFHRGDYSYGIYLYGWPIMQVMQRLLTPLGLGHNALILLLASAPAIVLVAVISWHVIEKPVLRLRKNFSFVARQRLAEAPPLPELAGAECDRPVIGSL